MGKGKSKRRRKANYLAAHPNLLLPPPPPPLNNDDAALPAKLRRIMHLKSLNGTCNNLSKIASQEKDNTQKGTIHLHQEQSQAVRSEDPVDLTLKNDCESITKNYEPLVQSPMSRKRKQGKSPDTVIENLGTAPVKKGLKERRKRFLDEKKQKRKKKKSSSLSDEASSPTQKQEKIFFGDVVQEPPKLKLPKKTNSISQERLRQQAIEAYRQRKGWVSRPGNYIPPSLTNIAPF